MVYDDRFTAVLLATAKDNEVVKIDHRNFMHAMHARTIDDALSAFARLIDRGVVVRFQMNSIGTHLPLVDD